MWVRDTEQPDFCFVFQTLIFRSHLFIYLFNYVSEWMGGMFYFKDFKEPVCSVWTIWDKVEPRVFTLVWRITYALVYFFKILYPHYVVPFLLKKAQKELCLPSVCEKDFMKLRLLHLCLSLFLFKERLNVCS